MKFLHKLSCILGGFLFATLFSMTVLAGTGQISFSDPTVENGSEVNVTMKVKSGDVNLGRADITLTYDSSFLEFESGTDSDGGSGTIRVHGASNGSGTGILEYNLKFKTLQEGETTISIQSQEVYDDSETLVEIGHLGTSTVTITAVGGSVSEGVQLSSLTVSPGTLNPEFSADVTDYTVSIGTDVTDFTVNAVPAAEGASVDVSKPDEFQMGDNTVTVTVTGTDGSKAVYNITVTKEEGGASQSNGSTVNEGVKLVSKEKTITIMTPGSDVTIPEGFAESTIDIDGHQVTGWVWAADSDHKYCIFYGMNDAGDLNFYRYDLEEKTIQRYFSDPLNDQASENAAKYPELVSNYDHLVHRYNFLFILCCVFGAAAVLLGGAVFLMTHSLHSGGTTSPARAARSSKTRDPQNKASEDASLEDLGMTRPLTDLHDLDEKDQAIGNTQIIHREDRLKSSSESSMGTESGAEDRTMVISDLDIEDLDALTSPKVSDSAEESSDSDSDVEDL